MRRKSFLAGVLATTMVLPMFNGVVLAEPSESGYISDVIISATFEDVYLQKYISLEFDANNDGVLSQEELDNATYLDLNEVDYYASVGDQVVLLEGYDCIEQISSISGIEALYNLYSVAIMGTKITDLDFSASNAMFYSLYGDFNSVVFNDAYGVTVDSGSPLTIDLSNSEILLGTYTTGGVYTTDESSLVSYYTGSDVNDPSGNVISFSKNITLIPEREELGSDKITVVQMSYDFSDFYGNLPTAVGVDFITTCDDPDYPINEFDAYEEYVMSSLGDADAPDIFIVDQSIASSVLQYGNVFPFDYLGLDSDILKEFPYAADFTTSERDGETVKAGHLINFDPAVYFYNKNTAKEVLGSVSAEPINMNETFGTWDGFINGATTVSEMSNGSVKAVTDFGDEFLKPYYAFNPNQKFPYVKDGFTYVNVIDLADFCLRIREVPVSDISWDNGGLFSDEWLNNIRDDKSMMFYSPAWMMNYLENAEIGFDRTEWRVIVPQTTTVTGGMVIVVNAASSNLDLVSQYLSDLLLGGSASDFAAISKEYSTVINNTEHMSYAIFNNPIAYDDQNITDALVMAACNAFDGKGLGIQLQNETLCEDYADLSAAEMLPLYSSILADLGYPTYVVDDSDIVIDDTELYFPDAMFRQYVLDNFDINDDGKFTDYELNSVAIMDINEITAQPVYKDGIPQQTLIYSLAGIENFENLKSIYINNVADLANDGLHVTGMQNLERIFTYNVAITLIDAPNCPSLNDIQITYPDGFSQVIGGFGNVEQVPVRIELNGSQILSDAVMNGCFMETDYRLTSFNENGEYYIDLPIGSEFYCGDVIDIVADRTVVWTAQDYIIREYDGSYVDPTFVKVFPYGIYDAETDYYYSYAELILDSMNDSTIPSPDVIIADTSDASTFISTGSFNTLKDLGFTDADFSDLYDYTFIRVSEENGQGYGDPYGIMLKANPRIILYNETILSEYFGADDLWKRFATWEDVLETAKAVKELSNGQKSLFEGYYAINEAYGNKPMSTWQNDNGEVRADELISYYLDYPDLFTEFGLNYIDPTCESDINISEALSNGEILAVCASFDYIPFDYYETEYTWGYSIPETVSSGDGPFVIAPKSGDSDKAVGFMNSLMEGNKSIKYNYDIPNSKIAYGSHYEFDDETWINYSDIPQINKMAADYVDGVTSKDAITKHFIFDVLNEYYWNNDFDRDGAETRIYELLDEYGYVIATPTPSPTPTNTPTTSPKPTLKPTLTPTPTDKPVVTLTPTLKPLPNKPTLKPTPVITPVIEITNKPYPPIKKEKGVAGFAERLYTTCLGRNSEPAGKAYWISELSSGSKSGAEAAKGFFFSSEMTNKNLTDEQFVTALYKTFMDRNPDAGGMNYWLNNLKNGSMDRMAVFNGFVESQEWANVCNVYGIDSGSDVQPTNRIVADTDVISFAERLYTTCLGRSAEAGGLAYWSDAIANREKTGTQAAMEFFFSKEFLNKNLSDEIYVQRLYATFMNRAPEAGGYQYWLGQLKSGSMSRKDVLLGFSTSKEFKQICDAAGIKP